MAVLLLGEDPGRNISKAALEQFGMLSMMLIRGSQPGNGTVGLNEVVVCSHRSRFQFAHSLFAILRSFFTVRLLMREYR